MLMWNLLMHTVLDKEII